VGGGRLITEVIVSAECFLEAALAVSEQEMFRNHIAIFGGGSTTQPGQTPSERWWPGEGSMTPDLLLNPSRLINKSL
jgi:hypothetical protein